MAEQHYLTQAAIILAIYASTTNADTAANADAANRLIRTRSPATDTPPLLSVDALHAMRGGNSITLPPTICVLIDKSSVRNLLRGNTQIITQILKSPLSPSTQSRIA